MRISIYSTDGMKVYEKWLEQLAPGIYTFTWDGRVNVVPPPPPPDGLAPAGLYVFDIEVIGVAPGYDSDCLRSRALRIGEQELNLLTNLTNFIALTTILRYILRSNRNTTQAYVEGFNPTFQLIFGPEYDGTHAIPENAQIDRWNNIVIFTDGAEFVYAGKYPYIIWAKDNFPDQNKAHRRRWTLGEVNYFVYPTVYFAFTNSTKYGATLIDTTAYTQVAYDNLGWVFNPQDRTISFYRGWFPLGQPEQGGSGICIDKDSQAAINALVKNAIWEFEDHIDAYNLLFNNDTKLTIQQVYSLNLDHIRLAVLGGCNTAGSPGIPHGESISKAFYDQGSDAVIGFRDTTSMSSWSLYYMQRFWHYLTKEGATVSQAAVWAGQDAVNQYPDLQPGQDILSWWVWGGCTVIYPAGWGN